MSLCALEASGLGANTFQIFSSSPACGARRLTLPGKCNYWGARAKNLDLYPLAIHANYLVNLAPADSTIRSRSIACFRSELERAAAIGAEYVMVHPGSYKSGLALGGVSVLLENTAGCGMQAGSRFAELRAIRDHAGAIMDVRVG